MRLLYLVLPPAALLAAFVALIARYAPPSTLGLFGRIRLVLRGLSSETGALTLVEAAKLSQDEIQKGVLEIFINESVVLDRLPLEPIEGNAYKYNEEGTLPGVEFRAVNSAYTESTGVVNQRSEALVILGGDADVDTYIVRTRGNLNDQRAVQTQMKVKAITMKFQDAFVNGDTGVDANSFDGLKKRLTGAQVIAAGVNGLPVVGNGTTDVDAFLDQLDNLIAAVYPRPDALFMRRSIRGKIRSAARRKGTWDITKDDFGKRIEHYDGIPMLDIGTKGDGTDIITQTETQGASSIASSIYAVHFGDSPETGGVMGLFNGPSKDEPIDVRDLNEQQVKPVFRTRVEFFCGLGVFNGKSAARLTGVLNS